MPRYVNASRVLPIALVREIQAHVSGCHVWVPATGRQERAERNAYIVEQYEAGVHVDTIARVVCLAPRTIYEIAQQARLRQKPVPEYWR